jgi:polysaccharide biosynthesis transport protein
MNRASRVEDPLEVSWRDKPPTLKSLIGTVRRQAAVVMLSVFVGIVVAFLLIVLAEPMYTARVSLYLDSDTGAEAGRSEVTTAIDLDTNAELIRSDGTTATVIRYLNLAERPEFAPSRGKIETVVGFLRKTFGLTPVETEAVDPLLAVISKVRAGLKVVRNGNTRVLDLTYTSTSPKLSVEIVNAFANAHIDGLTSRDENVVSRRIARLTLRVEDLRQKADDAGARIRQILHESDLFTADPLVLEERISIHRQDLSALQTKIAGLSAKLSIYTDFGQGGDVSSIAIDTPEARRLLAELAVAKRRLQEVRQRTDVTTGAANATETAIRNLEVGLKQEIDFEARAIEVERTMTIAEREIVVGQIAQLGEYLASDTWAELEVLQQKKVFYDGMYRDYLELLEGAGRERQARTDIRIMADALTPTVPSSPNIKAWLAIAVTLAALVGIAIASLREWNRHERSRS